MTIRRILLAVLVAAAALTITAPAAATPGGDVCYSTESYWEKQQHVVDADGERWVTYAGGALDPGWQPVGYTPPAAPDGYRFVIVDERPGAPVDCPDTPPTTTPETPPTTEPQTPPTTVPPEDPPVEEPPVEVPPVDPHVCPTGDGHTVSVDPYAYDDCPPLHETPAPPAETDDPPAETAAPVDETPVLPRTGAGSVMLAVGALALIGAGTVTVVAGRRRA